MKRIALFILIGVLMLTACSSLVDDSVVFNGVNYRTDFYGDLYVLDLPRSEEPVISNERNYYKNFYRVENTEYDLLITYPGGINGELYCPEANWEDAKAYYENPDNFIYYCKTVKNNFEDIFELQNIDVSKFIELMDFAEKNSYIPFNSRHNDAVSVLRMPIPDSPEYIFFKQSKDNLFSSNKGYEFLIADGKLVLLFYYDHNHGEAEPECVYVNIPEDLNNYFMSLISEFSD